MPALIRFFARLIYRILEEALALGLTSLRRVYQAIQHFDDMGNTMSCFTTNPLSSSISHEPAENDSSQDITAEVMAMENIHNPDSPHESPEQSYENISNDEHPDTDESVPQVAENSHENQSGGAQNSPYILVDTGDENAPAENQNKRDEIVVATLAFVLECCDVCVIL